MYPSCLHLHLLCFFVFLHCFALDSPTCVLSIELVTTDFHEKKDKQCDYNLSCYLNPSVILFDWSTVHTLAEFAALVRGTHKE